VSTGAQCLHGAGQMAIISTHDQQASRWQPEWQDGSIILHFTAARNTRSAAHFVDAISPTILWLFVTESVIIANRIQWLAVIWFKCLCL
jgi:hypothetical protein